jgi:excinuclease ABC subunit C
VFKNGWPSKADYRHYKVQGFSGQNDFASMREIMSRRYGKPDSPKPDLLVLDGGKGQLRSALEILRELKTEFPVVAMAKARTESDFQGAEVKSSEERLFLPNQKNELKIRDAKALQILTHLRNEAHRFAIEFHRLKRSDARGL